jgi:hypothetical protein
MLMRDVVPELVVALGAALTLLVVWLRSKTARAISETKMAGAAKAALDWAATLAFEVVMSGMNSAKDWKKELADGKITREELDAKLAALKAAALKTVQDATIGRLVGSGAVGSHEAGSAVVNNLVESAVVKAGMATATNPPLPPST